MPTKSFNNFSGGYTRQDSQFSEALAQLVYPSYNIDIEAKEDNGFGFKTMAGNKLFSTITGKSIYRLHEYVTTNERYLLAHTGDTVQEYNESTQTWTDLTTGVVTLTSTATTCSMVNMTLDTITVGFKRNLMFFTNGVDAPFIYEKGQTPEVQTVTATGVDGHTIRGNIAAVLDQRVFIADGATLYWSQQLDPFDFSTAISTSTDAGYKRFEGQIKAVNTDAGYLIVSTTSGFYIGTSSNGVYLWQALGTNIAFGKDSLVDYGSTIYYGSLNGFYPITNTQAGVAQVGSTISYTVDPEIHAISSEYKANMQFINAVRLGRDEMWVHIPLEDKSVVYIFRGKKGTLKYAYWLPPRYQQKVNHFVIFKDQLYSCTSDGKILLELTGKDYNGTFYPSMATTPKIHFGNYAWKLKTKPVVFMDGDFDNQYYAQTYINGSTTDYVEKHIFMGGNIWDEMTWDDDNWSAITLGRIDLGKTKSKSKEYECAIQFKFLTKALGDSFSIHAIDLTKAKKKNK